MTTKTIGGSVFTVVPLPAMQSFTLQADIFPAVTAAIAELGGVTDLGEVDLVVMGRAAAAFFREMPRQRLDAIVRELLQGATMDGKQLFTPAGNPFDVLMRGRALDTWQLLWLALEVSYPDFFGRLAGLAGAAVAKASGSAA